ncbi:MAG TPA: AmmeMemoRadiSam system protein B [Thermodesulfovibrionales bacterium]|nr:AmmeMemoRadiSam system protein B [Thermodesulfovibrionales bacterium]
MKSRQLLSLILIVLVLMFACRVSGKEPSVSGSFYPAEKEALKAAVEGFLSRAERVHTSGRLLVIVSPHAGYVYSGQVAAYGYKQIQGSDIKRVILIGPSHHAAFKGASVYAKGSFSTPLGDVRIDEKAASGLVDEKSDVAFYAGAFEREHSLEVQLPFLQTVLKDFTIVPILVGSPTAKSFHRLVSAISGMLDDKTIIVVSSDLSHYHDYTQAKEMDGKIVSAIERLSAADADALLNSGKAELCGSYPVFIAIEAARRLGATKGVLFNYANSGDVTGDKSRVVGYASMGLFREPFTEAERRELLSLARDAISDYVVHGKVTEKEIKNPKFLADGAVFVTIKEDSSLRGCIGHVRAVMPLYQSIIKNAVAASSSDPRFPPMKKEELKDAELEISILSPLAPVNNISDIKVGKHGLVIRKGYQSGLLLPQVASEYGWDRETFLRQLCKKAGLPDDSWKDADLYSFTAEIIK